MSTCPTEPHSADEPAARPDLASTPPTESEAGWVRVKLGAAFCYPDGPTFAELRDANDRVLHIWVTPDEAMAILANEPGNYSPLQHTQDLLAGMINQMGARIKVAHIERGQAGMAPQCRLTVSFRGRELESRCRPGDGAVLARRFDAPIFVEQELFASCCDRVLPPHNWVVDASEEDGKLTVSRAHLPLAVLLKSMLKHSRGWVAWGIALALGGVALQRGTMIGIGLIPLIQVGGTAVWLAILRETWLVADNSLEVRRTVLGIRRTRRYVGAQLYVAATSQPGTRFGGSGVVERLWVVERGRSRRIASEEDGDDVAEMARFLALYTGWPLDATDTQTEERKRV